MSISLSMWFDCLMINSSFQNTIDEIASPHRLAMTGSYVLERGGIVVYRARMCDDALRASPQLVVKCGV